MDPVGPLSDLLPQPIVVCPQTGRSSARGAVSGCPYCGRSIAGTTDMRRHILTHTGVKPYTCSLCGARFGRNFSYRRHMKVVHKEPQPSKRHGDPIL